MQLMRSLESVQQFFKKEIQSLQEIQSVMGKDIEELKVEQEYLSTKYDTTSQQLQALENQVAKLLLKIKKFRIFLCCLTEQSGSLAENLN